MLGNQATRFMAAMSLCVFSNQFLFTTLLLHLIKQLCHQHQRALLCASVLLCEIVWQIFR